MAFECQRNSYKREFNSKVVSCLPSEEEPGLYRVQFEDTILFPEGGGQPEDLGCLDGEISVVHVRREGCSAAHYTDAPLEVGAQVQMRVNWERRWDHMQQHSGQHLITAVLESSFGFKTVSWCLSVGEGSRCSLELDSKLSEQQLTEAELECNRLIREARPVEVRVVERDSEEFNSVRSRGLPSGSVGPIRVVDIAGVDVNMCCGTHVSNLSHLQCVKLLHAEQKGSACLVYFLVGGRVCHQLGKMYALERGVTRLLSCGPDEHLLRIERLGAQKRADAKQTKVYLREIAELTASLHLSSPGTAQPFFLLHRDDGDSDFMSVLCDLLLPHRAVVLLTGGGKKGQGTFMISGSDCKLVSELGPQVCEILVGKGGGKGARYQGKVQKIENHQIAFEFVKNYFT